MKKKLLSIILAVAVSLSLTVPALAAEDADWAAGAVRELNGIYGAGIFSADNESTMTEGDVHTALTAMGANASGVAGGSAAPMTRGQTCKLLAAVFRLPVESDQTAIQYLYEQNIVNGKSANDLGESDPITNAQFSVLIYRLIVAGGGGKGFSNPDYKIGNENAFAWTYLNMRGCVLSDYHSDYDTTIIGNEQATVLTVTPKKSLTETDPANENDWDTVQKAASGLWDAWYDRLNLLKPFSKPAFDPNETLNEAAARMVKAADPDATSIFSNIPVNHWAYDGVRYMVDRGYFLCMFDGSFGDFAMTRYQFAKILWRLDGNADKPGSDGLLQCVKYAVDKGYMEGPAPTNPDTMFDKKGWRHTDYLSREEMVMAFLKQQKVSIENVNASIVDRFRDADQISEAARPYLAYAVSHNMIQGSEGKLLPKVTADENSRVSRLQACILIYRQLVGLDTSKMYDYARNVQYVLQPSGTTGGN